MNIQVPDFSKLKRNTATEDEIKKLHETIKNQSVKNWFERHPFIMLLIGVVIGFLSNYILELLKLHHKIGL